MSFLLAAALLLPPAASAATEPAPLGVSYLAWRGGYAGADARLQQIKVAGFQAVAFVPTWAYVDRDAVDLESGPGAPELSSAIEDALRLGLSVVLKPHLDPPLYGPAFDETGPRSDSWRARCPWRGWFDVDPYSADYRSFLLRSFDALEAARKAVPGAPPARLDLGSELMDSIVEFPDRWVQLLAWAKKERSRRGLEGWLLLSHNFSHHFQLPNDVVDRMTPKGRKALARYVAGLDSISLSQYLDLTAAMPAAERGNRLPTPAEVDEALLLHEKRLRETILEGRLGLDPSRIPPLELGEFGIGLGGLRHPNVWGDKPAAEKEAALEKEIAAGLSGLLAYRADARRQARLIVLWNTGPLYDVFGWEKPEYGVPSAAELLTAGLRAPR